MTEKIRPWSVQQGCGPSRS